MRLGESIANGLAISTNWYVTEIRKETEISHGRIKSRVLFYQDSEIPTAVTLALTPCHRTATSNGVLLLLLFHTRIMLSPIPMAMRPKKKMQACVQGDHVDYIID